MITLSSRSFWTDEGYSFWFASQTLHTLWTEVPLYETHPPFYYTLLKGWMALAGSSEVALRMPSVIASLATVVLLACSGKILRAGRLGDQAGVLAAFLYALNKGSIEYAQQARPYALETFAAAAMTLSSVALVLALQRCRKTSFWRDRSVRTSACFLALTGALTLWLHNTAMFVVFGVWSGLLMTVVLDSEKRAKRAAVIAVCGCAAFLLWTPYLPFLLYQSRNVASHFWLQLHWQELPGAWSLATGGKWAFAPMFLLALLGLGKIARHRFSLAVHLMCVLLVPFTVVVTISYLLRPIFMDRLFAWMGPQVVALTAVGVFVVLKRPASRIAAVVLIVVLSVAQVVKFYRHPSEDWRALVSTIAAGAMPGDIVIVDPNEAQPALDYYARNQAWFPPTLIVPAPFPALRMDRPYPAGNLGVPGPTDADRPLIGDACAAHRRVWLVRRGPELYDPDGVVRSEILRYKRPVRSFSADKGTTVELFE
ncbi:glycosyltransferase family 39 protein [Burkholderia sp. SRS-W-2-2016]|uniref:glycosyltransferase family 39 protein n=1 Tax=Burkholderia sp. SRS-W-2-2016 TaxID=1926878 RepID=UPI00117EF7F7|nr:glycosyltransferase family 39 protein [Burkholderia sp. SRS-W-2-2016]